MCVCVCVCVCVMGGSGWGWVLPLYGNGSRSFLCYSTPVKVRCVVSVILL